MKEKLSYEELTEQWYNSLDEIKKLKKELSDLRKSFKSACRCCDRVKEKEKEILDCKEDLEYSRKRWREGYDGRLKNFADTLTKKQLEINKLKKELEESKKRVIDLEKCIELSLEADGIIEKIKEVKSKEQIVHIMNLYEQRR